MLTEKEIRFLNLLYKKLGGKNPDFDEVLKFIKEKIGLKPKQTFELAFLYNKNFEQANGDFKNVTNPNRMSFEDYNQKIQPQILAVMQHTENYDSENYRILKHGNHSVVFAPNEERYFVFDDIQQLVDATSKVFEEIICRDPENYLPYTIPHSFIRRDKRNQIAHNDTDEFIRKNIRNYDDIVSYGNIKEEYDNLERIKDKLNDVLGQLSNTKELMNDYLKLHRLGKEEEDQEEYIKLNKQISDYVEYINTIHNEIIGGSVIKDDMTIEEITNEVDEILYEIDYKIDELINETRSQILEKKFNEIYDQLRDDPFSYFQENFGMDEESYFDLDYVVVDCKNAAFEYVREVNLTYSRLLGYENETMENVRKHNYIIIW